MPSEAQSILVKGLERELAELRARDQLRSFRQIAGINLCSNDYLGLAEDPRLKEAVLEAVAATLRVGGTGSRLLSGHDAVWNELEEEFAAFAGTEAALYFANGYVANLGLLTSLVGKNDLVFSDELNHASLIDGIRLSGARKEIYPHLDLHALERALRAEESEVRRKLIVTESVFSMDGDVADVKAIQELAERFGASLIVDEAHATAVHGPGGAAIVAEARLTREVFATVHTCGKALASAGAFVCGSRVLREFLINHARTLIFSTAMPPYMAGQIRAALRLARELSRERETLRVNSAELIAKLRGDEWDTSGSASQIVPVILGSNEDALSAAEFLQERGFAVRAIRPPTVPVGKARLRLSLTARVTREQVTGIQAALQNWRGSRSSLAAAGLAAGHG
ncbi:MAG TPA: 8-amino-7-oxononanoate synthase [Candidatus Acidoferrum sp.]|nr:8-amino-7-oxononanoate synthase [Candidatus Acidoferrum sp.]